MPKRTIAALSYRTSTATSDTVWWNWNLDYTGTTTATLTLSTNTTNSVMNDWTWRQWNITYTSMHLNVSNVVPFPIAAPRELTAEEHAAAARRHQEVLARQATHAAERKAAAETADALLREHLAPEQRETLEKKGFFYLYTASGKKYRIDRGYSRNVRLVDVQDRVVKTYCAHCNQALPDADHMLSQKLLLEADEEQFLKIANVS